MRCGDPFVSFVSMLYVIANIAGEQGDLPVEEEQAGDGPGDNPGSLEDLNDVELQEK